MNLTEEELESIILSELEGNIMVLIDPKKKDSFNQLRINTWKKLVTERIIYHLNNKNEKNN